MIRGPRVVLVLSLLMTCGTEAVRERVSSRPLISEKLIRYIHFSIAQILLTLGGIIFHASIAPNSDPSKAIKG